MRYRNPRVIPRRQGLAHESRRLKALARRRAGALARGLAGAIVVPIFPGEEVIGSLGIANRAERVFANSEIDVLLAAARTIASMHPEAHAAPA